MGREVVLLLAVEGMALFFEGSEKKLELVFDCREFDGIKDLRELPEQFFHELVVTAGALIISKISNEKMTAYLLSESSMFVWTDRIVMITCGRTKLVDSALFLLNKFGKSCLKGLIFQRKNEYSERLQDSSFQDDCIGLRKILDGKAYRFGQLDSHYNYVFEYGKWGHKGVHQGVQDGTRDNTSEILMYHLGGEASKVLRVPNQKIAEIRNLFEIESLFPQWQFDDYVFSPYGYSLNGIYGDKYMSIHITPENEHSYLSFETNEEFKELSLRLPQRLIEIFKPETVDVINFNCEYALMETLENYVNLIHCQKKIKSGLEVNFYHLAQAKRKTSPVPLSGTMI